MTSYVPLIKRSVPSSLFMVMEALTIEEQVEYVWTAPCSIGTIMFVLNRYLPLIDTFISLHREHSKNLQNVFGGLDSRTLVLTTQNTPEVCRTYTCCVSGRK